jgi:hypothetical protein
VISPPVITGGLIAVRGRLGVTAAQGGQPGRRAGQGRVSQLRMRSSQSKIFGTSTYSSGVCAISDMPGP